MSHYHVSHPNKTLVAQIVRDNHDFQSKQAEHFKVLVEQVRTSRTNPILQKLLDEEKVRIEADRKWRVECENARNKWEMEANKYEQEQTKKVSTYRN